MSALRSFGWLTGLPLVAVLWAAATFALGPSLQATLLDAGSRIANRAEGSTAWLRLEVEGRDLVVRGEAPRAGDRDAALDRLAAVTGPRRIVDRMVVVVDASPFAWRAQSSETGAVTLSGHRPVELASVALVARMRAELGATAIRDEMWPARGAPPDFGVAAAFVARGLASLKPGAVVTLTDTVLSFEGEARDLARYEALKAAFAAPPSGFTIGRDAVAPPTVDDFRFVVARGADARVRIDGYAASAAVAATVRAEAGSLAPEADLDVSLRIGRPGDRGIDDLALSRFVLRLAALVGTGRVAFENGRVAVEGRAIDEQAVGEIADAVRDARPAGVQPGRVGVTAAAVAPYRLRLRKEASRVVVTGHWPDPAARSAFAALLRARYVAETVEDRSRISAGAPTGFVEAARAGVPALAMLAQGELELADGALQLTGESLYAQSAERMRDAVTMPPGWSATITVTARGAPVGYDAATCERLFAERVAQRPLHFANGSSELTPDFYGPLDAAAELLRHCPMHAVTVAGYPDPAGTPVQAPVLPEYTASLKPVATARTGKASEKGGGEAKPDGAKSNARANDSKAVEPKKGEVKSSEPKNAGSPKSEAKNTEAKKPEAGKAERTPEKPEPTPDLAEQRARAIVDYLLKAGVSPDRATLLPAVPSERRAVSLALRS